MTALANTPQKKQITRNRSVFLAAFLVTWAISVVCMAAPAAPSGLVVIGSEFGEFDLTWEDNATDEESYSVQYRVPPSITWGSIPNYPANTTSAFLTGGSLGTTYEFRAVAVNSDGETPSNIAAVTIPNRITSSSYAHIKIGEPFSFFVTASNGTNSTDVTYSASPLPTGLSINPDSGEISGTPIDDGYTSVTVEASYASPTSSSVSTKLALRIPPALSSPVINTPLPATPLVALSAPTNIPLNPHFTDPDTSVAVSMDVSIGNTEESVFMVFSLFDRAMPDPVTNFLSYVDGNSYSNNIFHRSVNENTFDIIQSGGFYGDGDGINRVPTTAPIENAPGIPNDRGTLAFARTSAPDSATSGWYINAEDSPGLDVGDSYAVFGRATADSLAVIDTIFNFSTGTHTIPVGGSSSSFPGFPTTDGNAPSTEPNNLIIVNEIVRVPVLTYALTSNSFSAVASASIVDPGTGPELQITPSQPGETDIKFTVTDIDDNEISYTHHVTVQGSYSSWIAGVETAPNPAGPTDNSTGGHFNNLQSYAFGGDPNDATDDASRSPLPKITNNPYDLSFYHRKFSSDLVYTVQYSSDLDLWDTMWTSEDGIAAGNITQVEDDGDFWKLTVRKTFPQLATHIFFRVVVTLMDPDN